MRSILVLHCMCKKKRVCPTVLWGTFVAGCMLLLVFCVVWGVPCAGAAAAPERSATMGTRSGKAEIVTDQATGDTIIRTPEARPVEEYTGPETIIVRPEIYPDRPGNRPQQPSFPSAPTVPSIPSRPQPPRPQPR